jgi:hypothetical protein
MAPPKGNTKTPAATVAARKKAAAAAGSKTTGETESDYSPAVPVRVVVSKTYGLSTYDKYAVSEYAEGWSYFYEGEFYCSPR